MSSDRSSKGLLGGIRERIAPWRRTAGRLRRGDADIDQFAYGRSVSMSQFGEDVIVGHLFSEQASGFYVDVGAFDPFNLSNTYNLYRRGWRGINIEPVPAQLARFNRHRPRDINLALSIGEEIGTAEFVVNRGFSSFADTYVPSPDGDQGTRISVPVRPLGDVLAEHVPSGTRIDLLDVDCEGSDATVLQSNDWERFRPRVVLAERLDRSDSPEKDPFPILRSHGYELHCLLHLTGVFVAEDF